MSDIALRPERAVAIPAMTDLALAKVYAIEEAALAQPQRVIFTEHVIHGGNYARTIMIPAGVQITGALVKIPTTLILSGKAEVNIGDEHMTIEGYAVLAASAGRKQVFTAITDTYLTMIFPTETRTVEEAEREFTDEFHMLASHRDVDTNRIVITEE